MYTDTKNVMNEANVNLMINELERCGKSKRKLRKVWKPLLRLITGKPLTSMGASAKHPNNANLNNALSVPSTKQIFDFSTISPTTLDDFATSIQKEASVEWQEQEQVLQHDHMRHWSYYSCESPAQMTVIHSASIEKSPPSTCYGCPHGLNCIHQQFHDIDVNLSDSSQIGGELTIDRKSSPVRLPTIAEDVLGATGCDDSAITSGPEPLRRSSPHSRHKMCEDMMLNAWLVHKYQQIPLQVALQ